MNLAHSSDSEFIRKLTEIVLQNLENEHFGVDELASLSGLGVNMMRHRIKILKQKTIAQFIHEIRLNKARDLLQENILNVSEVAWKTGFGSPEYFIRCYHEYYGYSPGEEKKRNHGNEAGKQSLNTAEKEPTKSWEPWYIKPIFKKTLYAASALLLFLIFGNLFYTVFSRPSLKADPKSREISIAVLPFKNDSPDTNNVFFFNRLTENISENLTDAGTFAVTPRRSVERYRDNKIKTSRQIAKELKVDYLVDGSGQKQGNRVSLTIHLISTRTDKYAFSLPVEDNNEDEWFLCIAMANRISSRIIDKMLNDSMTEIGNLKTDKEAALYLFAKAQNLRHHGDLYPRQRPQNDSLAEMFLNQSLKLDSTNAEVYNILSSIYQSRNRKDTASIFNDKALHFDENNARAYCHKAILLKDDQYQEKKKYLEKSIKLDPGFASPHYQLGRLYWDHGEFANGVIFMYQAIKKLGVPGPGYGDNQMQKYSLYTCYFNDYLIDFGYFTTAKKLADGQLKLQRGVNSGYVLSMLNGYLLSGRDSEAYNFGLQYKMPNYVHYNLLMGYILMHLRKYDDALIYLNRGIELSRYKAFSFMAGFALIQTGRKEEGEKMLDMGIRNCAERLNNPSNKELFNFMENYRTNPCISLASIYAVRGQKEKALEYLAKDRKTHPSLNLTGLKFIGEFPMLDNIRNEPEFKDYYTEAQKKFLSEKKKVEKFLRKEDITLEE